MTDMPRLVDEMNLTTRKMWMAHFLVGTFKSLLSKVSDLDPTWAEVGDVLTEDELALFHAFTKATANR